MFIDFTVENYRSIKEPVTLSAVAQSHGANEQDNKIAAPFSYPERKLELLPVLGIFGANASGKSNVVNALVHFLNFEIFYGGERRLKVYENLDFIAPFKLNNKSSESPSKFTLRVLVGGNIFMFHLSLNSNRILQEKLTYIPKESKKAVSRLLFDRVWNDEQGKYFVKNGRDFGENYREFQLSVRETRTFLGFLYDGFKNEMIEPLVAWLRTYGAVLSLDQEGFDHLYAGHVLHNYFPALQAKVKNILQKFDTGIEGIEIKEISALASGVPKYEIWVTHKTKGGQVTWLLSQESLGTQKLFELATKVFVKFELGGIMLFDELGFGTHPKINQEIVRLFQNKKINKNNAQLIFTSHDTTLLSKGLLRRDQIWFTQKREDGSTELYPLSDFGVRNDLLIDKAYLDGRFGAVPFLPDKEELTELLGV